MKDFHFTLDIAQGSLNSQFWVAIRLPTLDRSSFAGFNFRQDEVEQRRGRASSGTNIAKGWSVARLCRCCRQKGGFPSLPAGGTTVRTNGRLYLLRPPNNRHSKHTRKNPPLVFFRGKLRVWVPPPLGWFSSVLLQGSC